MEKTEINDIGNGEIIFFLGAGASVAAGVPDTEQFIFGNKGFRAQIDVKGYDKEKEALQAILEILKKKKEEISQKYSEFARQSKDKQKSEELERIKSKKEKFEKIDVELVLETLYKLNNKEVEILPDFFDADTLKIKGTEESIKLLEKKLRQFIRDKTIVSEDKIDYLAPLKDFVGEYKKLDIFSVNYDTCIEQFCKEYNLGYTDGFELYWHPELLDGDYDVNLYKIHGSVMWYLTDRDTYVKIPIATREKDEIKLITGETAKTLMVYPMGGKWVYAEPLLELIRRLHEKLEKAKICIVIGYSFRDDYIRKLFFEAGRTNKDLTVFLIAPNAGKIYDDKLKFVDRDKLKFSSLEGKVICWNYPMENVLKNYYLHRSVKKLSKLRAMYEEAERNRREEAVFKGKLEECVYLLIEIGYISKAEEILDKELGITIDNLEKKSIFGWKERLKHYYSLGMYHLLSSDYKDARNYFEKLRKYFEHALKVGNNYFDLLYKLSQSEEDKEKREKDEIERTERNSYYAWFTKEDWGSSDCSVFLSQQKELRSNGDKIDAILVEIKGICDDMQNIRSDTNKYKNSESFTYDLYVEIDRKKDAEKKMNEMLRAFGKLIDFCEKKEDIINIES